MELKEYYNLIIDEIKALDFKIIEITEPAPDKISPHLEAINYIIYDWNRDHKDDRDLEFEYVIQPKTDIDFNNISFDDFFNFIIKTKTDENVYVETKDIEVVKLDENIISEKLIIDDKIVNDEKEIQPEDDDFWGSMCKTNNENTKKAMNKYLSQN